MSKVERSALSRLHAVTPARAARTRQGKGAVPTQGSLVKQETLEALYRRLAEQLPESELAHQLTSALLERTFGERLLSPLSREELSTKVMQLLQDNPQAVQLFNALKFPAKTK